MTHYESRTQDRPMTSTLSKAQLAGLCYEYECAAVIINRITAQNDYGKYRSRHESNGDLVVLIIRDHKAITIMYRRSNQPQTCEALHVSQVIDLTN